MQTVRTELDAPATSFPWFESVGVSGFAAGGAAMGFAISLLLVWNSAPAAYEPSRLLATAQPLRGTGTRTGEKAAKPGLPAGSASGWSERSQQQLVTRTGPSIERNQDAAETEINAAPVPDGLDEAIALQEPPKEAFSSSVVNRSESHPTASRRDGTEFETPTQSHDLPNAVPASRHQDSKLMQRDEAGAATDPGNGSARVATSASVSGGGRARERTIAVRQGLGIAPPPRTSIGPSSQARAMASKLPMRLRHASGQRRPASRRTWDRGAGSSTTARAARRSTSGRGDEFRNLSLILG